MADNTNPSASNSKTSELLPRFYRSDANKKFLRATTDQLVQAGTVNKVNGFIGRQYAKATTADDIFVKAPTAVRQNYQLEPGITVKDELGTVKVFKDYQDYINQLTVFGSKTSNHTAINKQEFYSWDPHIAWDKFVNFQQYYWLPFGPELIRISGKTIALNSTFTVRIESDGTRNQYVVSPDGITINPSITLYKGQTYTFNVSSTANPFAIKTSRSFGDTDLYTSGITNNLVEDGTLTFTVPYSAPDVLFYMSTTDLDLGGVFLIKEAIDTTYLNVDEEIVGKQYYTLPDGTELSNGMRIAFDGQIEPASYATGQYYVEGVGEAIVLVNESILELVSSYTESTAVPFESAPFDSFPFSDASSYAKTPDYIVINRSSNDHNPWSRYNRWFHKDVIEASALYNGKVPDVDQSARAVRPIIEFEPNLKLFNFGTTAIADVDLVDTYTTDVFSSIEGQFGYNIDGVQVVQGQRILFTADTDNLVKNKIYKVDFVDVLHTTIGGALTRQIHLVPQEELAENQVVLVKQGKASQGLMYWYNGSAWTVAQQKTSLNQAPLFDVADSNGVSFSDSSVYRGSSFAGTKLFSYKVASSGVADSKLGFAISYKNISNIGDIVFNFNLAVDTFQYQNDVKIVTRKINDGMLIKTSVGSTTSYVNGWQVSAAADTQAAIRIYKGTDAVNNFNLDIFNDINNLDDLTVKVYVNDARLDPSLWSLVAGTQYKKVVLATDIASSDILTIRAYASQPVNSNGFYELPINLQHNPLNADINEFTLGEVLDHVKSIVDHTVNFKGSYPGANNLRDLGNVSKFGTKFVQHSGPASLSVYHITSENNNIIKAIESSQHDYNRFKRTFISVAETLGLDADPVQHVNAIMAEINKDKPKSFPYYFSDMIGYTANVLNTFTVIDYRIKKYPLSSNFTLTDLSTTAVYIYLNGEQLCYGKDYTFDGEGWVEILATIQNDDSIAVYEYDNTDGCFIPQTPTKLGIWPKFEPKIFVDTSLVTPRTMIQGHDGSVVLAYGDYRDALILELEKRIYNNIKVQYDATVFDIFDFIPGYNRDVEYSLDDFNTVLAPYFYKWTTLIDRDFTKPLSFDKTNSMTFNYRGQTAPDGREVPGYWRGIYRWLLDTDRPNLCPWEMLGFAEEPSWWTEVYGPAPYTSDNLQLWQDLSEGMVREPSKPAVKRSKFVRPFLADHIPVGQSGEVISPLMSGLAVGSITQATSADYVFGDVSPIEAAWRRSSYYPFAMLLSMMLLQPARVFGLVLDRSRIVRSVANQLIYKDTGVRVTPADIKFPSVYSDDTRIQTSGIINFLVDYIVKGNLDSLPEYIYDLKNLSSQVTYRIGGFTSKEKFNLLLDSKPPTGNAAGASTVFIPQEDYQLILNTSNPVKKITYSGIIITKLEDGFDIKGYSKTQPYFNYYPWVREGRITNVGGISESFSVWTSGQQYAAGKIVSNNNRYYRSKVLHSATSFNESNFQSLSSLPVIGGRDAYIRTEWDRESPILVPYGTKFRTVQDVVDFIVGYGEYLKDQGFIFDEFNTNISQVLNWETSAKEFMFWTTQNWSSGQDKWTDWIPSTSITFGDIVRYNGDYYRALQNIAPSDIFDEAQYVKLDGLSTVGSSVISLSPAANKIAFTSALAVVDDIGNKFNDYEIFKVDGTPILTSALSSYRDNGVVTYTPLDGAGIYSASFYLVQKEQVAIINNSTMFNDTIFNPSSGYKQDRIKLAGYVTTDWSGAFEAPGFVFDQAVINDWEKWQDYALGDIVKHKEFYYTAKAFTPGTESFEQTDWYKLDKKPVPALLPNWTYKAGQFTDFYSLDSDNFDAGQQKMAQHLIGYQKRQYLENIIKDDVSEFKFYQGMIIEKGSQNVLNKLFDVLSATDEDSVTFYEEWALRVGQYGASSSYENIEFVLDEALFKSNPQAIELVNTVNPVGNNFVYQQTPTDVYVKPIGYNNNPWPAIKDYVPFLRNAGHVRVDEAAIVVPTINDILKEDNTSLVDGAYIWCGFEGASWNVFRHSGAGVQVVDAAYDGVLGVLTIKLQDLVPFAVGEYISIARVPFNGFYKIDTVELDTFTIKAEVPGWVNPFTDQQSIVIFKLVSHKFASIDLLPSSVTSNADVGELVWTGGQQATSGDITPWATWKYEPVYKSTDLINNSPATGLEYGRSVFINSNGSIMGISTSTGEIIVYDKVKGPTAPWLLRQTIDRPEIAKDTLLGNPNADVSVANITASSVDGRWLAVASPAAGSASTWYMGAWNSGVSYAVNSEVKYNNEFYKAIQLTSVGQAPTVKTHWKKIKLITVDVNTGTQVGPQGAGVVSLYEKDRNNNFSLVGTIVSPTPTIDEHFGSSIAFGNNKLFVGASGYSSGTGIVYQLDYSTTVEARAYYNPTGSNKNIVIVDDTTGIEPNMVVRGPGFTSGQVVGQVVNSTTLILSGAPDSEPSGILEFTTTAWTYSAVSAGAPQTVINSPLPSGSRFGDLITISTANNVLLISAPGNPTNGNVLIYKEATDGSYDLIQTIAGTDPNFGLGIAISESGSYIAVSSVLDDDTKLDQGAVFVYEFNGTTYDTEPVQKIVSPRPEAVGLFGGKVGFVNDYETLVIYSENADDFSPATFDMYADRLYPGSTEPGLQYMNDPASSLGNPTTFDSKVTQFRNVQIDNGQVYIFDRYGTSWVFAETLDNPTSDRSGYGTGFALTKEYIIVGAPYATDAGVDSGKVYEYRKPRGAKSWTVKHQEIARPDLNKIKKAFLYNKSTNQIVSYLDVIDPTQGKIAGIAEQELRYKTFYDPAVYSAGTDAVTVDDGMAWGANQVGMLWWDLRTAKFVDSYDNDVLYRNATWNTVFPGATIDIYEWVETSLLPTEWKSYADTEVGLTENISGQPLYGDSVYCLRRRFDNISNTYRNTYYYWVKNKRTVPNVVSRRISANTVANLIQNPRGEGHKYLALTGTNSFTLVNAKPLMNDTDIVLSVEYWINEATTQNTHAEWKIVSNNPSSSIPTTIETKWFDSLCGKDAAGRVVPDTNLSPKLKYGVENRPRQSMFVNRFEALKQFVERANRVFEQNQIASTRDISGLETYDAEPTISSGVYDIAVDTIEELRFAGIGSFVRPSIVPTIVDGSITGATIVNRGSGYLTPPTITIVGSGTGAVLKAVINAKGWITGVTVVSKGQGYTSGTALLVRDYCVLVHSDSGANDAWAVHSYDPASQVWSRVQSQAYDSRKYWKYIDWYATGYTQFTAIDYSVNTFVDLNTITPSIGDVVKIRTTNTGNWLLLEKYAESESVDWTQQYKVVGDQNGTIQLLPTLYEFKDTTYGFDGQLFDGGQFDNLASEELRYVLLAVKNDLLIDDLRTEYLDLFFTSVRYALGEQNYLDWVFKTSFVKAQHNLGNLQQSATYNSDNLENYEDYINEVKPYRTKIREYVSAYSNVDNGVTSVTDFDLMPTFASGATQPITVSIAAGAVVADNADINLYPWKHWKDHVGFKVTELKITNAGAGYVSSPKIIIEGGSGTGATATGFVSNGVLSRVVLLTTGAGYLSAPTVTIDGGHGPAGGTDATAVAIIGDSVIRSNLIKIKFDRITQTYFINQLEETESFTGTGIRLQWPLKWSPDTRVGKTVVTINGVDALADSYKVVSVKSTARGYTSYAGSIIFDEAVAKDAAISVTYTKDWALLNAADRIQYYYDPATGDLGNDLSQLMTGVDYGGVVIDGLDFNISAGWSSTPYYSDKWDSFDSTYDDYSVTVVAGTTEFPPTPSQPFPTSWVNGDSLNVYYSKYNVETHTVVSSIETMYPFNVYDLAPVVSINRTLPVNAVNRGTVVLTVTSTAGLKIGDVATCSINGSLNYNTKITALTSTTVTLDQIILVNLPADTEVTFVRTLITPVDCAINGNGTVILSSPVPLSVTANPDDVQVIISSYLKPVRIDTDGDYTYTDSSYIVDISSANITVGNNDKFTIRKSTSDGSVKTQEQDYDTALSGGDLAYSSAIGLAAEEIIVDGDGLVTPTSSPATEEVVPGQLVDTVAIKVYDKPNTSSTNIKVDSYIADGTNTDFEVSQYAGNRDSVIVKVSSLEDSNIKSEGTDYEFDYDNRLIKFVDAPAEGNVVSIFSFSFAGEKVLDLDYFVGDGTTLEFITRAQWQSSLVSAVYESGDVATVELFQTDDTYESADRVGIRFTNAPIAGSIINYVLCSGTGSSYSVAKTERIQLATDTTYDLSNTYGTSLPIESSMIVKLHTGSVVKVLEAPNNSYFTIGASLNYSIDFKKFEAYSVDINSISVIVDNTLLRPVLDYTVDLGGIIITLNAAIKTRYLGKTMTVCIRKNNEYTYVAPVGNTPAQIIISDLVAFNSGDTLEITNFYKHNVLDIQRTSVNITSDISVTANTVEYFDYKGLTSGRIKLDRAILNDYYVMVTRNGELLTPGIDFKLNKNRKSIKLAKNPDINDKVSVMTYSSEGIAGGIAYMQFKDMLNRIHFKRLSKAKQTTLASDFAITDTSLEVTDASNFDEPNPAKNKPGVVEIYGERIEYFKKDGNVLSQLRRGTLGTGARSIYLAGTFVQEIGPGETLPYVEQSIVDQVVSDGTTTVNIGFVPGASNLASYQTPQDTIEVFVGGYDESVSWAPNVEYAVNALVTVGTYTYKCITAHTSGTTFNADVTKWKFFVGNIRLKKAEYKVHNSHIAPESPEGDVTLPADFTVTGTDSTITLASPLKFGTKVTVVKRLGADFDGSFSGNVLGNTGKVADFLKSAPGIWYTSIPKP